MQMPIWDHLEELRERVLVGALAAGIAVLTCFAFSKDLVVFLEAPVASQGVRFLQLSPGEFFFTTLKVRGAPFQCPTLALQSMPGFHQCNMTLLFCTARSQSLG